MAPIAVMWMLQATVVHDMNAIDPKLLSVANRVTIADEAMSKFRDKRREAGKNWHRHKETGTGHDGLSVTATYPEGRQQNDHNVSTDQRIGGFNSSLLKSLPL